MTTEVLKINKEIASKMLESNTGNRHQTKTHIAFLADQMKKGMWKFTGDPIRFSDTGKLLDGQHRLMAIIQSDTEHDFLVQRGHNESIFDVLDTGRIRRASDVLSIEGIPYQTSTAAVARMILKYENTNSKSVLNRNSGGDKVSGAISNTSILDFVKQNDISEYVKMGHRLKDKGGFFNSTEYAFFSYLFDKISSDDCSVFMEKLACGVGLTEKDPVLFLRNKMIDNITSPNKLSPKVKFGYVLKGWNLFRKGETCKYYRFSNDEPLPPLI